MPTTPRHSLCTTFLAPDGRRTRVVDANGNEIPNYGGDGADVAPPHPDVQGVDQETSSSVGQAAMADDAEKSSDGVKEAEGRSPKPASEGNEATAQ